MPATLEISIIGPMSQTEMETLTASEAFNKPFNDYIDHHLELYTKDLTESEMIEFNQWWKGPQPENFWKTVSKPAYNALMNMIAAGCG